MFEFFTVNELIPSIQSSFKRGNFYINYLLCATHDIYQSFDNGLETRAVYLDTPKAFNIVWNKGLLYKLEQNSISGYLLNIITDFLNLKKKRVVLKRQHSTWVNIEARVPQRLILQLLFFLIYINDLPDHLTSNPKLFVDDTSLFSIVRKINSTTTDSTVI